MINSKLYFRSNYSNKDGESPVLLLINHKGKVKNYSLKIAAKPSNWNDAKRRIKAGDPDYIRKNRLLSHYEAKAIKIVDDHAVRDKPLSLSEFMRLFKDEQYGSQDFFAYADKLIRDKTGVNEDNTIKSMTSSMKKLRAFCKELTFGEINLDFIQRYERFLKVDRANNDNSISKSMRLFKAVVNDARRNGLIEKDPFADYKIGRIEGDREHLTENEVNKLLQLYGGGSQKRNMQNVLRYFLFACFTGLSFADIKDLRKRDITSKAEFNGKRFISMKRKKTGTQVLVPLIPQALALLPDGFQRLYDGQKVFKVLTSQPTNRYIKEIVSSARINKKISFHCGRHTFATLCKSHGINYDVIAKYLGHADQKTTAVYAKYETSLLVSEMSKME